MKWINKWWPWVACIIFWAVVVAWFCSCDRGLRKENERLRQELALAQQHVPLQRTTIGDSVEVVTQKVVEVERIKEVLSKEDRRLLKDLSLKVSDLESFQKLGTTTADTVFLTVPSTAVSQQPNQSEPNLSQQAVAEQPSQPSPPPSDSVLTYHDAWTDFTFYPRTSRLSYRMRDSLAIAVERQYRHKFLFFRWGTKGYNVKIANHNPRSTIRYNTFVKRRR